jgi:hypothetical protein
MGYFVKPLSKPRDQRYPNSQSIGPDGAAEPLDVVVAATCKPFLALKGGVSC